MGVTLRRKSGAALAAEPDPARGFATAGRFSAT